MKNPLRNIPYPLRLCLLAFQVLFAAGVVSYFIFGVVFLITDRNICPVSPLWIFSAVYFSIMIFNLLLFFCTSIRNRAVSAINFQKDPNEILGDNFYFLLYHSLMNTGLFVYNSIVLYTPGYICTQLRNSGLYFWSYFSWALLLFTCIILDYMVILLSREKFRMSPEPKNVVRRGNIGLCAEGEKLI